MKCCIYQLLCQKLFLYFIIEASIKLFNIWNVYWATADNYLWYNLLRYKFMEKVIILKWFEVKNIYPNQFVKFEVLKSYIKDSQEFVDEVAVIGPITDENATKELLQAKDNILIYHTSKDSVVIKLRTRIRLRRVYKNEHWVSRWTTIYNYWDLL